MALQDFRPAALGHALRPNIWDIVALILVTNPARAETVNCAAITALPAVITVPGVYCLTGDLSTAMTSGNAIEIQANFAVLDMNGFKLDGHAAGFSL